MTTALFLSIIIFVFSIWFLASPLVAKLDETGGENLSRNQESLLLQKEEIFLTLHELELDYQLKKISKQDYDQLYAEAVTEGAGVLKKMETSGKDNPVVPVVAKFCHHCGAKLLQAGHFCSHCGTKIFPLL